MSVEELEDLAMVGKPLPNGLPFPEIWLYMALRLLHTQHRLGQISRSQAVLEKRELLKTFSTMELQDKLGRHHTSMWKEVEKAAAGYAKERTLETADDFYKAVYGLQRQGDFRNERSAST